jgi:hypothetical protein
MRRIPNLFLAILLVTCQTRAADPTTDELARLLLKRLPPDTLVPQQSCRAGEITLETMEAKTVSGADFKPTRERFRMAEVEIPGKPTLLFELDRRANNSIGIVMSHPKSGYPMLQVGDDDGDGRLDFLSYTVLDSNGNSLVQITDYEMDGQPDLKFHLDAGYMELWHDGQWLKIEKNGDQRGVWSKGVFLPLKKNKKGWPSVE